MAWTTPVTHAVGDILTASDWNIDTNDLLTLEEAVGLYGVGSALHGSPPAVGTPNSFVQAGVQGVAFSSGAGTLTFPTPFPTGTLICITQLLLTASSTGGEVTPVNGGTFTASAVALWGVENGSALNSNYNVQYLALGF